MPNQEHGVIDRQNDGSLEERPKCRPPGERTSCQICPRFASGACGSLPTEPVMRREVPSTVRLPEGSENCKGFARKL